VLLGAWWLVLGWHSLKAVSVSAMDSLNLIIETGKGDTNNAKAYYEKTFLLFYKDLKAAKNSCQNGINLSEANNWEHGVLRGRVLMGEVLRTESKYDSCIAYGKETAYMAKRAGNSNYLVRVMMQIATSYESMGDWKGGVEALQYAREVAKPDSVSYRGNIARVEYLLSVQYFIVMDYDAALFHLYEARRHFQVDKDVEGLSQVENELGNNFQVRKDYEQARIHYLNAIRIAEDNRRFTRSLGARYQNLGICYYKMGNHDSTLFYFNKARAIFEAGPEGSEFAHLLGNIAGLYYEYKKPEKSLFEGRKAYALASKFKLKKLQCRVSRNLAMSFVLSGKADSANHYFLISDSIREELYDTSRIQEIAKLRIDYEADLNQAKVDLLDAKAEALEMTNERKTYWMGLLGLGFVVAVLVAILLLLRSRHNRRMLELELARQDAEFRHRRADLEQRALRAQMNPHFIFNCLNAIQRLYVVGDLNKAGEYMSDFAQLLRKILTHSSRASISIAEEVETLELYLRLEQARLDHGYDFEIEISEDIDIYHTYMPPLLIQPFAENAIWHGLAAMSGQKGLLKVSLHAQEDRAEFDRLECIVQDNGIGIEASKKEKASNSGHESKGMSLTRERLGAEGSLEAFQPKEGGTIVRIVIPVGPKSATS
jgi:tetratricopeptide (TPR) repeat protein/two-component sensor histidine kinase